MSELMSFGFSPNLKVTEAIYDDLEEKKCISVELLTWGRSSELWTRGSHLLGTLMNVYGSRTIQFIVV